MFTTLNWKITQLQRFGNRAALTLLFCLIGLVRAFAQTETASFVGTVHDPRGAPVPGAEITATRVETRAVTTSITNGVGIYTFVGLAPGH